MSATDAPQPMRITQATYKPGPAFMAFVAPSGGGKTLSALRVAHGLAAGKKIVVIDTEGSQGRALAFAHPEGEFRFDFLHLKLDPPYTPERYLEAFRLAEAEVGPGGVVIIDSMSAEHEDQGGTMERHEALTGGNDKKNMAAWQKIRPPQRRMLHAFTHTDVHLILCFRAEDKTGVGKDGKPIHLGWQAIGWKRIPYEMQIAVLLSIKNKGVPILDGFEWGKPGNMPRRLIPTDRPMTEADGVAIGKWLMLEVDPDAEPAKKLTKEEATALGKHIKGQIDDAKSLAQITTAMATDGIGLLPPSWRKRLAEAAEEKADTLDDDPNMRSTFLGDDLWEPPKASGDLLGGNEPKQAPEPISIWLSPDESVTLAPGPAKAKLMGAIQNAANIAQLNAVLERNGEFIGSYANASGAVTDLVEEKHLQFKAEE